MWTRMYLNRVLMRRFCHSFKEYWNGVKIFSFISSELVLIGVVEYNIVQEF